MSSAQTILSREEIKSVVIGMSDSSSSSEDIQHRFYNGNTLAVSNHINQVVHGSGLSERDKSDMRSVADSMMEFEF